MIKFIKKFLKKYPHTWSLLIFLGLLIWFQCLESVIIEPKYIMHIKLDDYIPYMNIFVIPYIVWFPYIGLTMGYMLIKSKDDFIKLSKFLYIGMALCYLFYMIYPNGQDLRPNELGNGILDKMVGYLYRTDTPTNSVPSIHVINSIAVNSCIWNYRGFKDKVWIRYTSFVLCVLICISTVAIKQHSVVDVFAGLGVSTVLHILIYKVNWQFAKSTKEYQA